MCAQLLLISGWSLTLVWSTISTEVSDKTSAVEPSEPASLEAIFDEWERREPRIERALVRFERYEYDDTFGTESRGEGMLHYEPRDRCCLTLRPAEIPEGVVSRRRTLTSDRFKLLVASKMIVIIDRHQIVIADPETKTYTVAEVPPNHEIWAWEHLYEKANPNAGFWDRVFSKIIISMTFGARIDLQASLLTGTNVKQLRETFDWTLTESSRDELFSMTAHPKNGLQARQFKQIDILLDAVNYRTTGVRIIDPAGTKETVLVPKTIEFNQNVEPVRIPSLRGYTLQTNQPAAALQANEKAQTDSAWGPIIACGLLLLMVLP